MTAATDRIGTSLLLALGLLAAVTLPLAAAGGHDPNPAA